MGARLAESGVETVFRAAVPQAPGARLVLSVDGRTVREGQGRIEARGPAQPGAYRVEAMLPGHAEPWIVSNPIVLGGSAAPPFNSALDQPREVLPVTADPALWTIEREPTSSGSVQAGNGELQFSFQLAPGRPRGQFAALVSQVRTTSGIDRVAFVARAAQPMRISLQVRLPGGKDGLRWRRSVYLDTTPRRVTASLEEFDPAESPTTQRPIVAPIQSLLFVVDTLNTLPGTAGTAWISDISLAIRTP
jgi:hypothetical protein